MSSINASSFLSASYYGVSSGFFNSMSTGTSSSSFSLGDYASIKNGTYSKLMKAYYGGSDTAAQMLGSTTAGSQLTENTNATSVRDEAKALKDSANKLLDNSKNTIYDKTTVKDADGNETTDYDRDAIYKAVAELADNYNSLINSAADSKNNTVLRTASSMIMNVKANTKVLDKMGITIGSDNKLKIDADKFNKADVSTIKSVFGSNGSLGYNMATSASSIYNSSVSQLAQINNSTYNSNGGYNYVATTFNQTL